MLTWVELDAAAIRHNLDVFRERLGPDVRLAAVIKSNAYGHGMLETAALTRDRADWLAVNSLDEAIALREAAEERPILVMGWIERARLDEVVRHDLRPVLYDPETAEELGRHAAASASAADRKVSVHIKVETGTHRQGISAARLDGLLETLAGQPALSVEGVSTHFANIEDTTEHSFAATQIETFAALCERVETAIGRKTIKHAACSAATLLFTRTHLDLARIGISLYGIWPSRETRVSCGQLGKPALDLQPALTWKTRVAQVKDVDEGGYVGYGCTWRATRPSRIVVLPVGYHEGYDRGLSGAAHVLIRGKRAPVRGRVCMNMCMVDVTDIPGVEVEDEVVLLGAQGDERVSADQLAAWCGTISYEVLARIHPGLPRVVVGA